MIGLGTVREFFGQRIKQFFIEYELLCFEELIGPTIIGALAEKATFAIVVNITTQIELCAQ
ncbi:hypothetical protein SAMN05216562_3015 [Microbulbifer marinus]|uniref:Uncharacterized protein n=1 Tax=Microbulbifer marinus TaxID=658218 RepID=A0A1H4B0Q1_9GAMM|nr:hypothetical protein SAMN05216562_3015 [Microbulbifer marinus]